MKLGAAFLVLFAAATCAFAAPANEETAWEALQNQAADLAVDLPQDEAAAKKMLGQRLEAQGEAFKKYIKEYPHSPNRWEARMGLLQAINSLAMLEQKDPDIAGQKGELESIANDPDAPQNIRADAGLVLLQIASMDFDRERTEASSKTLSAAINKFLETHPDDARAPALRLTEAQALETFEPDKARRLYEEAAKNEDQEISEAGKTALELMALREKPLEVSFTALDGSKVDLADLRGKVVLIDFWATWCPPCVEEVPEVVEAYKKFKDRGFEIIGISLDEDKDVLVKFTKEHGMTWPQFFDGKGWENSIAKRFKIQSVPTMWLIDREGKLADASPRGRLEEAIGALLAKPAKP